MGWSLRAVIDALGVRVVKLEREIKEDRKANEIDIKELERRIRALESKTDRNNIY